MITLSENINARVNEKAFCFIGTILHSNLLHRSTSDGVMKSSSNVTFSKTMNLRPALNDNKDTSSISQGASIVSTACAHKGEKCMRSRPANVLFKAHNSEYLGNLKATDLRYC